MNLQGPDFSDSRNPIFSDSRDPMIIFADSRDPNRVLKTTWKKLVQYRLQFDERFIKDL